MAADLQQPYPKAVLDLDVRDVLQEFGQDLGILTVVSADVKGKVKQLNTDLNARAFLDEITAASAATWYLSNGVVYVDPVSEISQRVYDLEGVDRDALMAAFKSIGIDSSQLPFSFSSDGDIAFVSGPDRFLTTVTDVIALEGGRLLTDKKKDEPNDLPSVFRGRVAQ
jgi:type III secretion protein C